MKITTDHINYLFAGLINNNITREAAQDQAFEIQQANDAGQVQYDSAQEEDKIWNALEFIQLYAERSNDYVYSMEDLIDFISENGWELPHTL